MSNAVVELVGAVKRYRTEKLETTALNAISMAINAGEFVAVMGPSGCGKSSLLNAAGLLDRLDGGSLCLLGSETQNLSERQRSALRRQHIGFVFQSFNLIEQLTVEENVELALHYNGVRGAVARKRVDTVLERLQLSSRRSHYPSQLSGGQQQRVAIARAVINQPALILADEPTGNLDSENRAEVLSILRDLNTQGTTVVMVTHSPEDAARASRIVRLKDGQLDERS